MIDPAALDRQRRALDGAETTCPGCNARTRDRTGTCGRCRRIAFDPRKLTDVQLVNYLRTLRQELQRRRDALDAAIKEG